MVHLDEDVIRSRFNPFRFDDPIGFDPCTSDLVRLYIVSDSASLIENASESDVLLDSTPSNELFSALLPQSSLPASPTEDSFQNNVASDHEGDEHAQDDSATYSENHSRTSSSSSNEYSLPVQAYDDLDSQSERAYFSHDVFPWQKDHYLTNAFRIDKNTKVPQKSKGGISFLQGWKTEEEIKKKKRVLACVRVPTIHRLIDTLRLILYAVFEESENGKRLWYKHDDKGFLLSDQLRPDAKHSNPIKLPLQKNGDYELKLYMLTLRDKKTTVHELIFELNEQEALRIHRSPHMQASPTKIIKPVRLLCVLEINNVIDWKTIGLSNFISSLKADPVQALTNTNATMEVTQPSVKRQKTK